jgi:dihydrolipoamide dehydrogenase
LKACYPAVVFTDPELAWCGLTEAEAKEKGIAYQVAKFPWSASGRALSFDRTDGVTKMIVDPETNRVLGVGICGAGAGELIAEAVLAMEMGATVEDIALTVHPHPTLSETVMEGRRRLLRPRHAHVHEEKCATTTSEVSAASTSASTVVCRIFD